MSEQLPDDLTAEEWLVVADQELARTRRFLAHEDPFAAYCLESAVQASLCACHAAIGETASQQASLAALCRHALPSEGGGYSEVCGTIARLSAAAQSGVGSSPAITDIRASLATVEPMLTQIRDGITTSPGRRLDG